MSTYTVLIADDESSLRKLLSVVFKAKGYNVILAQDGEEALSLYQQHNVDLMLIDIRMPKVDGLQVLKALKQAHEETPIILMTAYAGVDTAVEALKQGAFDYIVKPFDLDELNSLVAKALNYKQIKKEGSPILEKIELYDENGKSEKILTNSPIMMELCRNIAKVSQTNATVLITGESGTGKELVAKAIHYHSKRSTGPFIKVNCAALPENLLESTLFGHEKGAFTGAQNRQAGLFERANNGTLLLDEVGEMSTNLQVKLLRVLQEKEFEPIGSSQTIQTNFRLITATNRNLQEMIGTNDFRLDLFYRLNVMPLVTSPLRSRPEDIVLLSRHFVQKFCLENQKEHLQLSDDAMEALNHYSWPGNVRELSNAIEHAVVMSTGAIIYAEDLPNHIQLGKVSELKERDENDIQGQTLKQTMKDYERELICNALKENNGHREQTAKTLGVSKRTLIYKIQEYSIDL